jgi:toxin ParE1/3/4
MARKVSIGRLAAFDLQSLSLEIASYNQSAARRFVRSVDRAKSQLADHPFSGMSATCIHPNLAGMRKLTVPGFRNYLIFYRVVQEEVELLRILHGAQDLSTELQRTI